EGPMSSGANSVAGAKRLSAGALSRRSQLDRRTAGGASPEVRWARAAGASTGAVPARASAAAAAASPAPGEDLARSHASARTISQPRGTAANAPAKAVERQTSSPVAQAAANSSA